jgi:hypothetical protein
LPKSFPLSVFCSYAHADKRLKEEVKQSLAQVVRDGIISEIWSDREITPGDDFAEVIDARIDKADLILLLVSRGFLDSSYCMGNEVERALERRDSGEAHVIPIILRDCDWHSASFGRLQALPEEGKPIQHWRLKDARLLQVAKGIRKTARLSPFESRQYRPLGTQARQIPSVLPYLCDRGPQEATLESALELHIKEKPNGVFLCVVHGSEEEDHIGYLERLRHYTLPRILQLGRERTVNAYLPLEWPKACGDQASALEAIAANLAHVLNCTRSQLSSSLFAQGSPVIITSELLTEDWRDGGEMAVSAFLEFWSKWPRLAVGQSVFALLLVKYRVTRREDLPSRPKYPRLDSSIRRFLTSLDISKLPNASGIALPELHPIVRSAVETWIQHPYTTRYCPNAPHHEKWRHEISALFENRERIPMSEVAASLRDLLAQC